MSNEMNAPQTGDGFYCESGFGIFEKRPFVQISIKLGDEVRITQIAPDNARNLALNLLECAEAADMDAIIIRFLVERMNQTLDTAVAILSDFRNLRDALSN